MDAIPFAPRRRFFFAAAAPAPAPAAAFFSPHPHFTLIPSVPHFKIFDPTQSGLSAGCCICIILLCFDCQNFNFGFILKTRSWLYIQVAFTWPKIGRQIGGASRRCEYQSAYLWAVVGHFTASFLAVFHKIVI